MSRANLKYLTSEQALNDVANFIEYFKKKHRLPHNKWIVFGCSYAGNLAAWLRLKFPNLVAGAIASSAPVHATVNFQNYLKVATESLDLNCISQLAEEIEEIHQLTIAGRIGWKKIEEKLRFPVPFNGSDWKEVAHLHLSLIHPFLVGAQYVGLQKSKIYFQKL